MFTIYLTRFHENHLEKEKGSLEDFLAEEIPILREQFRRCILISCFIKFAYCYLVAGAQGNMIGLGLFFKDWLQMYAFVKQKWL